MKSILTAIIGGAFLVEAYKRFIDLGISYIIDCLLMGQGLSSFKYLNIIDLLIFIVSASIGLLYFSSILKGARDDNNVETFKLGCKDCIQCYPDCPLKLHKGIITKETERQAFYHFSEYRRPESTEKYLDYIENHQHHHDCHSSGFYDCDSHDCSSHDYDSHDCSSHGCDSHDCGSHGCDD